MCLCVVIVVMAVYACVCVVVHHAVMQLRLMYNIVLVLFDMCYIVQLNFDKLNVQLL